MLTLEQFRIRAGWNAWHFWQLADSEVAPINNTCNTLVGELAWQSATRAARTDVVQAIRRAAVKLKEVLNYPVEREQTFERMSFPQPASIRQQYARSQDSRGRWLNRRASFGWVRKVGVLTISQIATPALTLIDTDGDGIDDAAMVNATFLHGADEAALYLPASEWAEGVVSDAYRVYPSWQRVGANTLTAQIPLWLLVKRELYRSAKGAPIPIQPSSFVSSVMVARRYVDTATQGYFVWESQGEACSEGDDPSLLTRQSARFTVRDESLGWIAGETAEWDATNLRYNASGWALGRQPDAIEVNYVCGRDDDDAINEAHYLMACAELKGGLCTCGMADDEITKWQEDRAESNEARSVNTSFADLENPFGTKLGQIEAWKLIRNKRRADASVIVR